MRILLSSYPFAPDVGGIETISLLLARQWSAMGHTVTVVTNTAEESKEKLGLTIVRRPSFGTLRHLVKAHDVYFQSNISLNFLWAWIGTRQPLFIAHHTWLESDTRAEALRTVLKRFFIQRATSISVSRAIADAIAPGSVIIGNAYDDHTFRLHPEVARNRDLVFVGRLVEAKGVDVLLRALQILQTRGLRPNLTVIGSGPEENHLRALSAQWGLEPQIEWAGTLRGETLAKRLNAHRILVAPSTWQEPFGIVALEGIGCGCGVVGSRGGGLGDAIGPCGALFENGNPEALAHVLAPLLENPARLEAFRENAPAHLAKHRAPEVARAYLQVFQGS